MSTLLFGFRRSLSSCFSTNQTGDALKRMNCALNRRWTMSMRRASANAWNGLGCSGATASSRCIYPSRHYATLNQVIRGCRKSTPALPSAPALYPNPQLRGTCLKVYTTKPKKPNSAQRKVARVRLSNGNVVLAYIPGEGHGLQEHSVVLVRGGRCQDVPGVRYKCVRGKWDLEGVKGRKNARSKYGVKKPQSS